ncbi:MAG: hypothetical protein HFG80_06025 [Eubacterium sp.]|nr:hypothetical protein [Eubacterium sp.]
MNTNYSTNLANGIAEDICKQEELKLNELIRHEKEIKINRRIALGSLIVGILALIVALLNLIFSIV